jgi:hypothetical protein
MSYFHPKKEHLGKEQKNIFRSLKNLKNNLTVLIAFNGGSKCSAARTQTILGRPNSKLKMVFFSKHFCSAADQ